MTLAFGCATIDAMTRARTVNVEVYGFVFVRVVNVGPVGQTSIVINSRMAIAWPLRV